MKIVEIDNENYMDVRALHHEVYGWAKDACHFKSLYLDDTGAMSALGFVARDDAGKAVAYYGIFICDVLIGGSVYVAGQSGDTMTHPDHQGKGLFTLLAQRTYERAKKVGVSFVFGIPNGNSYPGFKRKLGWNFPRKMVRLHKNVPTLPFGFSSSCRGSYAKWVLKLLGFQGISGSLSRELDVAGRWMTSIRTAGGKSSEGKYFSLMAMNRSKVIIKLDRFSVLIGAIHLERESDFDILYRKMLMLCLFLGRPRMLTYLTDNCYEFPFFSRQMASSESLWLGGVSFDEHVDLGALQVRFLDYDTF